MIDDETYKKIKSELLSTLLYIVCEQCGGKGHLLPQCGTFRNLDKLMKSNLLVCNLWIAEKKKKINTDFFRSKCVRKLAVHKKLLGKKRAIESKLSDLQVSAEEIADEHGFT
jgi:hypothetical protein